ncbi:MAG: diguanylate cyclase [Gallionellaceae bacterium]|nr:diguanylate cyclase [Gallionellaceae bacterium]
MAETQSNGTVPKAASSASESFYSWVPSPAERRDMVELAAYHIAERSGFKTNPQECWAEAEAQVNLLLALRENQKKLQSIVDTAMDAVVTMNARGIITGWNTQAEKIFGWPREEAIGCVLHETIISPQYREAYIRRIKNFLDTGEVCLLNSRLETLALHRDGHEFLIELSITPVKAGGTYEFNSFIRDITERSAQERVARLATTVFNTMDEAVMVTDADNKIITVNPAFAVITGYSVEEVIGKSPSLLASGRHQPEFFRQLWELLSTTGGWQGEIWNRRKSGEIYVEWLSIKQVLDEEGNLTHYVALFSDISERKVAEERMHHLAHYDVLTDLPNRALFRDRLQQAFATAKRGKARLALMFVDLDEFKPINDTHGHNIGDMLLKEVATRIQDCVRESDTVARIGGDEFIVLLPTIDAKDDAMKVAEKIRYALDQHFELASESLHISSSIGVAIYPEHGSDEKMLLKNSDTAMYHAKKSGRNNVQLYRPEMQECGA